MDVHTIVMKKTQLFSEYFPKKISELAYTMQFLTLFLTMYLEAKFDFVVMEKNDIYWTYAPKN